ncbi:unnamed protein product [Paramecium sonneborni]|nr:unnamed protein product [Paramecium sonneborni]
MIALSSTLESTTKNINENMSKVSKTVSEVDEKAKKAKELIDKIPGGNQIKSFF